MSELSGRPTDQDLRRAALALAEQLPVNRDDALKVCDYLLEVTNGYLFRLPVERTEPLEKSNVCKFGGRPVVSPQ